MRRLLLVLLSSMVLLVGLLAMPQSHVDSLRDLTAMRLIGHEILKVTGDLESRVLPVQSLEQGYRISFERNFSLDPRDLEIIANQVISDHDIADDYWVEVRTCINNELAYNYQKGPIIGDIMGCGGRLLPEGCYQVIIIPYRPTKDTEQAQLALTNPPLYYGVIVFVLALIGVLGRLVYQRLRHEPIDPNVISIGASKFDKKNMALTYKNKQIELSHKEVELLDLLQASANTPIEREVLLNKIWGDEGQYVGRTLDVFISRLRKKLEGDHSVKIVNIRGVGYKLVMGD